MPLRDDATRQLRVPIAAAACQCDEDWHSGKLSLKIPLFPLPYQSKHLGRTRLWPRGPSERADRAGRWCSFVVGREAAAAAAAPGRINQKKNVDTGEGGGGAKEHVGGVLGAESLVE